MKNESNAVTLAVFQGRLVSPWIFPRLCSAEYKKTGAMYPPNSSEMSPKRAKKELLLL